VKCLVLKHVAFEDLGLFEHVLSDRSMSLEYRQAGVNPLQPQDWLCADLVVVLGGPIGVYETDNYPWLLDEIAGIRERLAAQMPTLGICLGAQLMAAALGARVYPGVAKEIGWSQLDLTTIGQGSSLAALAGVPVLHWHGDTYELPKSATLLASTRLTPHQAFAVGKSGLALQFHPEVDCAALETWLIGHTFELTLSKISIPKLRAETLLTCEAAAKAGQTMFATWLKSVGL